MISRPPRWVDRKFPGGLDVSFAPLVLTRLIGATARVRVAAQAAMVAGVATAHPVEHSWSIAEQIGHVGDLETLWNARLDDYDNQIEILRAADMTNRATTEAHHDKADVNALAERFATRRTNIVRRLESMSPGAWVREAKHPRLGIPMRVIDFMAFVAEHDDHHLAEIAWLMTRRT